MTPAYAALLSLHVLAGVLWVGGMATMHFVVRPTAAATLEPPARLAFLSAVLGRFLAWAGGAVVVVLATGLTMIETAGGWAGLPWRVHVMSALGVAMAGLYGWVRFALYPRLRAAVQAARMPEAAQRLQPIRRAVAVNLALGVGVVVVAVGGRSF